MYKVFVADKLAPEGIAALGEYPQIEVDFTPGLSVEDAIVHARDADAIIVRSATKLRGALLDACENLKVVGRAGIGVDNIDVAVATERGIVVLNTPDANATTTAELAIAHIFSLSRQLPLADRSVRSGEWTPAKFLGAELSGKTVGIIGFGTIGRLVAERCLGLKMKVIGFDPFVTEATFSEHQVEVQELDALLQAADYVTLHCPVTDGTRGLISTEKMALMKPGARLINCARGGLIDEAGLLEAVTSGHLAGAALDVFEQEPPTNSPLFEQPNIYFTPHLGASTHEAQTAVGVAIAHQIAAYLTRQEITNAINVASIAPDKLRRLEPYLQLVRKLGRLLCMMCDGAITELSTELYGRAAELDAQAISNEALVGLLTDHLSVPVNQVNAAHLARRQGINVTQVSSRESRDYLSVVRLSGKTADSTICLEGTLFDERQPRLIRVNDFSIESELDGQIVMTRHADQPGVIGAIGELLGREGINITRMQVGIASKDNSQAIGAFGVSSELSESTMQALRSIEAIDKAMQIRF
ncbi:MAG: D-3-phosphoglycerate dehydrogenase [Gammaproteobacteria bacterium]|jgi:D-3-phosphoglycerate dehydrogenase